MNFLASNLVRARTYDYLEKLKKRKLARNLIPFRIKTDKTLYFLHGIFSFVILLNCRNICSHERMKN